MSCMEPGDDGVVSILVTKVTPNPKDRHSVIYILDNFLFLFFFNNILSPITNHDSDSYTGRLITL